MMKSKRTEMEEGQTNCSLAEMNRKSGLDLVVMMLRDIRLY